MSSWIIGRERNKGEAHMKVSLHRPVIAPNSQQILTGKKIDQLVCGIVAKECRTLWGKIKDFFSDNQTKSENAEKRESEFLNQVKDNFLEAGQLIYRDARGVMRDLVQSINRDVGPARGEATTMESVAKYLLSLGSTSYDPRRVSFQFYGSRLCAETRFYIVYDDENGQPLLDTKIGIWTSQNEEVQFCTDGEYLFYNVDTNSEDPLIPLHSFGCIAALISCFENDLKPVPGKIVRTQDGVFIRTLLHKNGNPDHENPIQRTKINTPSIFINRIHPICRVKSSAGATQLTKLLVENHITGNVNLAIEGDQFAVCNVLNSLGMNDSNTSCTKRMTHDGVPAYDLNKTVAENLEISTSLIFYREEPTSTLKNLIAGLSLESIW